MYKTQKDLQQRSHHAWPQIPGDPRISHSNLCRSEKNFTKLMQPLDPLANNLQNLKIGSPKMAVRASKISRYTAAQPLKTVQICPLFLKTDYTMIFYGLRLTKPKNFKTKEAAMCPHAPPATSAFITSGSHAATRHLTLLRYDVTDDVILH